LEIDSVLDLVRPGLERVRGELAAGVRVEYPIIATVLENLVAAGGKRLRPALVFLSAHFGDYDLDTLVPIASSVEMLHTATLVHDDTIDHALLRRGNRTLNSIINEGTTILMGDYMFAQCAVLIAKPGIPRVTSVLAQALADICDGELQQAFTAHRWAADRVGYAKRIYCKTAALFAAAAEMGAIASHVAEDVVKAMREYGRCLGIAFQIIDDVLDFRSSASELGKPVGNDLRQGIVTLPVIWYAEHHPADHKTLDMLRGAVEDGQDDNVDAVIAIVSKSGALEAALTEAKSYVDEAKKHLLGLPDNEYRQALFSLADYAVERRI
jgi:geranylgeranyl pyrophosphate synthase